jgi:predicted metal-dependent phosphoesterase TrpH
MKPSLILKIAKKRGLKGIAITDHNEIEASLKTKKLNKDKNFMVITGEEVRSIDGHILALGIKELIPLGLTTEEVIDRIHDLKGIAIAAHPLSIYKQFSIKDENVIRNNNFDGIEVLNGGVAKKESLRAEKLADELKISKTGGSDAHIPEVIGCAGVEVEGDTQEEILDNIKKGKVKIVGKHYSNLLRFKHYLRMKN